jgi:hypothetical protein
MTPGRRCSLACTTALPTTQSAPAARPIPKATGAETAVQVAPMAAPPARAAFPRRAGFPAATGALSEALDQVQVGQVSLDRVGDRPAVWRHQAGGPVQHAGEIGGLDPAHEIEPPAGQVVAQYQ